MIAVAVEPKTEADRERMAVALGNLTREDPTLRVGADPESGQTIIRGMGELHLEVIVERMKREFKVEASVGKPQVAYRETIRVRVPSRKASSRAPAGGPESIRSCVAQDRAASRGPRLRVRRRGRGRRRAARARAGRGSGRARAGRERRGRGLSGGRREGHAVRRIAPRRGFDRDRRSRSQAGMAFKDGVRKAKPVLLEPIMNVEVVTPEQHLGTRERRAEPPPRHRARLDDSPDRQDHSARRSRCPRCSVTRRRCAR